MKIKDVTGCIEGLAPLHLQEDYDNAGLLIGNHEKECTGIMVSLDVTEQIVEEARKKNCNLIVAHHPIIFKGLKKLNGKNYVERTVISAIKNNIAVYAVHTNLDNIIAGVNKKIAEKLNLQNCQTLLSKEGTLKKLVTFSPRENAEEVRNALFKSGAGAIGNYSECSFNVEGSGTFKAGDGSDPFVGEIGERHLENETRIEVVFPGFLQNQLVKNLKLAHPYEEVAYYISTLDNSRDDVGSGLTGELNEEISEAELLKILKENFNLSVIKHTQFLHKKIKKIALCGGAGFFLLPHAIAAGAQAYITGDIKYHTFFDADSRILLADIGHYESEQYTIDLVAEFLQQKFPNFAVLKTEMNTNPVIYYT
jgi:dinuclear metal center YbgI/SA1388 family protein